VAGEAQGASLESLALQHPFYGRQVKVAMGAKCARCVEYIDDNGGTRLFA